MNEILDFLDRMEAEIGYGCKISVGKYPENDDTLIVRIDWPNKVVMQVMIPRNEIRDMKDENSMEQTLIDGAISAYKSHF